MCALSKELLQDSEVTLRLVDELVAGLADHEDDEAVSFGVVSLLDHLAEQRGGANGPEGAERLLVRVYAEIQRIVYSVRRSRGLLEDAALGHLENTNAKLREVSSTTEFAATSMLDGVDRALGLVDRVEAEPTDAESFGALRDELHALVTALQFQDITSQQIEHASAILGDLEAQLRTVAELFAATVMSEDGGPSAEFVHPIGAFDPAASVDEAESRQAVADDIFGAG
jgi:hypothetical protein